MLQQIEPIDGLHAFGSTQQPAELPDQVRLRHEGGEAQGQAYQQPELPVVEKVLHG